MKLYWQLYYMIFKPFTRKDYLVKQCRLSGVSLKSLELVPCKTQGESDWHAVYVKALGSKLDG